MSESESGDSEAGDLPTAAECEARCQEFAAITTTDSACAMFFLQDTGWDVQVGLLSEKARYDTDFLNF